jgi:hypothetical protein
MPEAVQVGGESWFRRALPGLTLMIAAPMVAEVLPGATRLSVIHFVLPIEIVIWGGGAVMIREVVRRWRLGWLNMLLLAMALSMAEEFLIQQTSLAPVVVKIHGVEYARALGVNYVYFLWALIYESTFVVLVPVGLCELVYWRRRDEGWLNWFGMAIIGLLFLPGCFMAWFAWTQRARPNAFHVDVYNPPPIQLAIAAVVIIVVVSLAIGGGPRALTQKWTALRPPHPAALFVLSGLATVALFALQLLAFGMWPEFPPVAAVASGLGLVALLLFFLPRFWVDERWSEWHSIAVLYGTLMTIMALLFLAFRDASPVDFYGKVVLDAVAVVLMVWLAAAVSWRVAELRN